MGWKKKRPHWLFLQINQDTSSVVTSCETEYRIQIHPNQTSIESAIETTINQRYIRLATKNCWGRCSTYPPACLLLNETFERLLNLPLGLLASFRAPKLKSTRTKQVTPFEGPREEGKSVYKGLQTSAYRFCHHIPGIWEGASGPDKGCWYIRDF